MTSHLLCRRETIYTSNEPFGTDVFHILKLTHMFNLISNVFFKKSNSYEIKQDYI